MLKYKSSKNIVGLNIVPYNLKKENMKRILGLACSEILCTITVLLTVTIFSSAHLELFVAIAALIYLPLGIIFNKVTGSKSNKILNFIAMLICIVIFAIFAPQAIAILSEQTLSFQDRIYAAIICKFALILFITWPGVYDAIAGIGNKIKALEN